MTRLITRAWEIIRTVTLRDFWWAEFGSALALIVWAVMAITSPDRLSRQHFGPLLHFFSETALEDAAFIAGAVQLAAVVLHARISRIVAAICASMLTGSIFLAIVQALGHPQPAVGYYGVAWGTNLLAAFRLIRRSAI